MPRRSRRQRRAAGAGAAAAPAANSVAPPSARPKRRQRRAERQEAIAARVRSTRSLTLALIFVIAMAVVGVFATGEGWREWFESLEKPGWLVPLWVFFPVAALVYALGVFLLYRVNARAAGNSRRTRWWLLTLTVLMLVGNEAWNYLFLGRQSVDGGFLGMLLFAPIVVALWLALWRAGRRVEWLALTPYLLWVGYDIAWTFEVWRLNG
jgi:translocator protein